LNCEDAGDAGDAEVDGVDGQVAGLETVDEWQPGKVAKGKHEAEAVGGDVHGGENGRLHPQCVGDVEGLEGDDQDHGVGDAAVEFVLVGRKGEIEDYPPQETGTHLAPDFDVDFAEDGESDAWVEFATNEPVVDEVAGVASCCELAVLGVARLDGKGADVDEAGEEKGDEEVDGDELGVVFPDECPDDKVGALEVGTCSEASNYQDRRIECYQGLAEYPEVLREDILPLNL
jgi:hypothetical protein